MSIHTAIIDHTTHMIFRGTATGARLVLEDIKITITTTTPFVQIDHASLVLLNTDGNIYHVFPIDDTPETQSKVALFRQICELRELSGR